LYADDGDVMGVATTGVYAGQPYRDAIGCFGSRFDYAKRAKKEFVGVPRVFRLCTELLTSSVTLEIKSNKTEALRLLLRVSVWFHCRDLNF